MFPPTVTSKPARSRIFPVNTVVVDLPFVPVIAITRPCNHRDASSISAITGTPRALATSIAGCSGGTPGLSTTRSARSKVSSRCAPSSRVTPRSASDVASAISSRRSDSVTRAPRSTSSSAAAIPLRAAPTTTTFCPATEKFTNRQSPQLQRRQAEQRAENRENHKARDHFRLAPPDQLEVVVERSHLEYSASGELERRHLNHHRQRFEHEHAAHDSKQQFLLDQNRDGTERGAERQRPYIAHEDLCRVRVE